MFLCFKFLILDKAAYHKKWKGKIITRSMQNLFSFVVK